MNFPWQVFINLGIIAAALLLATFIRAKVRFFQKFLIPNALTAGFILLPFYNYLAPLLGLSADRLGPLVYHLLAISFIAMLLRRSPAARLAASPSGRGKNVVSMAVGILSQYAIQAVLGLGLTFLFIYTFLPDLFPSFGFFIPLGFALGPGQAFAIGTGWEPFGFAGAGSVGLTFAAFGFLWACFGGVFLINYGIRKKWMSPEQIEALTSKGLTTGIRAQDAELPVGARLTTESEALDSMTFNAAAVLVIYLLTYLLLQGLTHVLSLAGNAGRELATNLWGLHFIFAALITMLIKRVVTALKVDFVLDNGSLTRISGTAVDIMVAAAIGAISLVVVGRYWLPILIMGVSAGILALLTLPWLASRLFRDHKFHRTLILFGAATGTMPTGLALLRVIDPEFETPAASDFMYGSGITFALAIPLILIINFPAYGYKSGNPSYYWIAIAVCCAYLLFTLIAYTVLSRKRAFEQPGRLWLRNAANEKRRSS